MTYLYLVPRHLDLKQNGQIWIQQNNTELRLDEILTRQGVDRAAINLGFRPDWMRELAQVEAA